MTKTKKVKKSAVKDKVNQSQLGVFLKLIAEDTPLEDITSLIELADRVSENFDVICTPLDLEMFFNLDDGFTGENFEVESRKQEFYKGEYYGRI